MEWSLQSAEDVVSALRAGEVSSVELTDEAIARIERDDEVINAICVPDFDRARVAAQAAVPAGHSSEGLPVGVQLIGPMFEDRTSMRLAELLEREIGDFHPPR